MRIRISALADYASVAELGKLNIMGIFTKIYARSVPAVHNEMQVVVKMIFEPSEAGEKVAKLYLDDMDGKIVLQLDGKFTVPPSQNHEPIEVTQILKLQGLVFPDFGSYEFKIDVDDHTELLSPLDVVRLPDELNP